MARREGVVKHDDLNHGLFGKLNHNNDGEHGVIKNISRAANYVKDKVEAGTHIYDNVISIPKEDFERLGYDEKEAWEQLVKDNIYKLSDKVGIEPHKTEYLSALHIEGGKPNLHLLFWDTEQGVPPTYSWSKIATKMRADVVKYVYQDDIKLLGQNKTTARDKMIYEGKIWGKEALRPLHHMGKDDFEKLKDEVASDPALAMGKVLNRNFLNSELDEMRLKILQLMEKLPQEGRLAYGFLSPDLKIEVLGLAEDIIKDLSTNNADFEAEFNTYKNSARDLAGFYTTNEDALDAAEQRALDDLTKRLANQLLKNIKDIDYNQYLFGKAQYTPKQNQAAQRNTTLGLLAAIFRQTREENRKGPDKTIFGNTDNIIAKREAAKTAENSRMRWGHRDNER